MNKKWRRYEVLLPARFNDGSDVSEELLGQAVDEIMASFSGATYYKEAATGYWREEDILFCDSLGLLVVDVPDTAANRKMDEGIQGTLEEAARSIGNLDGELSD